jgi:hypothetical protein
MKCYQPMQIWSNYQDSLQSNDNSNIMISNKKMKKLLTLTLRAQRTLMQRMCHQKQFKEGKENKSLKEEPTRRIKARAYLRI